MDVDVRRQMLYFTDEYNPVIYEHDLERNSTHVLYNVGHPEHLSVDWVTGNLYFYDRSEPSIKLCSIQRQVCSRIITFTSQVFVKSVVVDPINRILFYSVMHFWIFEVPHSIIYRADMDGQNQLVLTKDVSHVTSLQCETENKLLYITDISTRTIKMIDYEGKQLRTIVEKQNLAVSRPIGITLYENQALVLNMASSTVGQCKLYGDYECRLLELNVHNSNQLLIVQESRQPDAENVCDTKKINCNHVCVPGQDGSGKCICHNGEHIDEKDICPHTSDAMSPKVKSHLGAAAPDDHEQSEQSSTASTVANVFLVLLILTLLIGGIGFIYRRRFQQKFDIGMHFHNPELSTVDAAEVKMFQNVPRLRQTATHTELTLETPPPPGAVVPSEPGSSDTARQHDITTTALELENMSDADSMKDAYDCGDDPRQRLIM